MASGRIIKTQISISEQVNDLSIYAALLFTWMIPHADDFGRMPGGARKVKALVVPMRDDFTSTKVEECLCEMHRSRLVQRYEIAGETFLEFPSWDEHQHGLHKRTTSKFPAPTNADFREIPGNSGKFRPELEQNRTELEHGYKPPYPPFADSAAMPTEDTASGLPEPGRTSSRSAARTKGAHSDRDRSSRTAPARETGKDTGPSPVILPDFLPEAEWLTFVEHRKALKAPMTPIAETRALAVLGKFHESGMNPREVISQSIVNGWKGLFPLKTATTRGCHGNTFDDWNRSDW